MATQDVVYVGDVIGFTLTAVQRDGVTPMDLTLYDSVEVLLGIAEGNGTYSLMLTMTPSQALADGTCRFVATAGQLNPAGFWAAQVVGIKAGLPAQHSSLFEFEVLPVIA
jgi:hypothetical protein